MILRADGGPSGWCVSADAAATALRLCGAGERAGCTRLPDASGRPAGCYLGVGAGVMADAGWRMFCHFSEPAHVLSAHLGGVAVAAIAGWRLAITLGNPFSINQVDTGGSRGDRSTQLLASARQRAALSDVHQAAGHDRDDQQLSRSTPALNTKTTTARARLAVIRIPGRRTANSSSSMNPNPAASRTQMSAPSYPLRAPQDRRYPRPPRRW